MTISPFDIDPLIVFAIVVYLMGVFSGIFFIALAVIFYCRQGNSLILTQKSQCQNLTGRLTSSVMKKRKLPLENILIKKEFIPTSRKTMGLIFKAGKRCGTKWKLNLAGIMSGLLIGSPFISLPEKKKYLERGKVVFWVLNKTVDRAILIDGKHLEDDYLEVIPNTRYPKGEYFYDIPIHLTKFIDLT